MSRAREPAPEAPSSPAPPAVSALPQRALRWLLPLLVLHSGLFVALASPQRVNAFAWTMAFVPMLLALDLALRGRNGGWQGAAWRVVACTLPVGIVFAMLTGDWVVHTAHVYGGLPMALAYTVSWLGYGALFGLELAITVGLPFALTRGRPLLALLVVPLWCTVLQLYVPRFLFFTYGQLLYVVPELVQIADVLGSGGLNLLYLPAQLVLFAWVRHLYAPEELSLRTLGVASLAVLLLFGAAYGYGARQMQRWAEREAVGQPVHVVGIQPNFSLAALASNPTRERGRREESLDALLGDSTAALQRARRQPAVPTVLLWPESVYPAPYFLARGMREQVQRWVREAGVHLILASTDARLSRSRDGRPHRDAYGVAVHVDPEGSVRAVYDKIALIPWGETIPFGDWLPGYRRLLQEWIPQISQFTPGREPVVFPLENGPTLAPMICFDAANPAVAQGMAAKGARLGVVLANLAWFGPTTVSNQFGFYVRFRALENRMPILLLSQNGESMRFDARGQEVPPRLPQFETAAYVATLRAPRDGAYYSTHARAVHAAYALALAVVLAIGWAPAAWRRLKRRAR